MSKSLANARKEVIVIESNSTDGTRQLVQRYQGHADYQLILQDKPRGKGHAVRAGLAVAQGDILMIQDADLEYDLNDYDDVLAPVLDGRAAFVLGSRHKGQFKIRQFTDKAVLAFYVNSGHVVLTAMLNLLYHAHMTDPFTMYKVFRRECIQGMDFECNGFDFDWELVTKLLRAGYQPLEVPVNYRSRSFSEGKKISLWRDPLVGLRAMLKYRFWKKP